MWTIMCIVAFLYLAHGKGKVDIVEHSVQGKQALQEAKTMHLDRILPGCKECSHEEIIYCTTRSVMDDHCCCDRKHRERFPFIPHTCYLKFLPTCSPVAGDCEKYARVYFCCCQHITQHQWKGYAGGSTASRPVTTCFFIVLLARLYK